MHDDGRDIHFAAGRRVTVVTVEKAVFRVAEIAGDKRTRRRQIIPAAGLVAGKAFAVCKAAFALHRRMALETGFMRGFAVRDGKVDAAHARFMASRAVGFRVLGVIKFDAEAPHARDFRVASAAVGKIVRAEGSFFVVTGRAAVCRA